MLIFKIFSNIQTKQPLSTLAKVVLFVRLP